MRGIECVPYRTPACERHLPNNDSDDCPWCEIERLTAENRNLKEGLLEALEWNWCDEDFPESLFHNLSLLAGGQGLVGQTASNRQETEMTPRESDVMHHALRESVEIVDD